MHGMSLGPADLAASRGMKTTRVGGGHPAYGILADPGATGAPRAFFQQDLWHYTLARMVDACAAYGIKPFYGPFGDFADAAACEAQFRNAFLHGCVGAWTLHPTQIDIAKRVFSLDPKEVAFAKRIVEAMPDGTGAAMIDGKMQDDATWKQAKVILDLARLVASQGPRAEGPLRAVSCRSQWRCRPQRKRSAALIVRQRRYRTVSCEQLAQDSADGPALGRPNSGSARWCATASTRSAASFSTSTPIFNNTEEWWQSIPAGRAPAQGPALLPPAGRERADRVRRLRLRAEPAARRDRARRCAIRRSASCSRVEEDGNYRPLFLQQPH